MADYTGTTHWLTGHKCPDCGSRASTYGRGEVIASEGPGHRLCDPCRRRGG